MTAKGYWKKRERERNVIIKLFSYFRYTRNKKIITITHYNSSRSYNSNISLLFAGDDVFGYD